MKKQRGRDLHKRSQQKHAVDKLQMFTLHITFSYHIAS